MLSKFDDQQLQQLRETFAHAKPFRHVVIDDFFQGESAQLLLDNFPAFEDRHALNEFGLVGGKAVRTDVRELGPTYAELDTTIQSQEFLDLIGEISGIPNLKYDPYYIGGGTHENRSGQGLDPHIDFNYHPITKQHRRLNLIVYLNPDWQTEWGGSIELHSDPWVPATNQKKQVLPCMNRAVLFETNEHSWHGFEPVNHPEGQQLSRKSFAIYLYTDERPAEEIAPDHATVYVPITMPDSIQPGKVVDQNTYDKLRDMVQNGLGQLKFLYEREKTFAQHIAALEHQLAEHQAHLRLPIHGPAIASGETKGLWPDGWCAQQFSAQITATQSVRSCEIAVRTPKGLAEPATLNWRIGDETGSTNAKPGKATTMQSRQKIGKGQAVTIEIQSNQHWQPSEAGQGDERKLAFLLTDIEVK